jgi:hypothetical protein
VAEIPLIEQWFVKIGDLLPSSMRDELEPLKLRLGRWPRAAAGRARSSDRPWGFEEVGPMIRHARARAGIEVELRREVSYWCVNGHHTARGWSTAATAPELWVCRHCGLPAGQDHAHPRADDQPAGQEPASPPAGTTLRGRMRSVVGRSPAEPPSSPPRPGPPRAHAGTRGDRDHDDATGHSGTSMTRLWAPTHPEAGTDDPDLAMAIWRSRAAPDSVLARTRRRPDAAGSERDNRLPGRDHP